MADKKKVGVHGTDEETGRTLKTRIAAKKTECTITRAQFLSQAKPLTTLIDGQPKVAPVKEFSTGSFGWYLNEKIDLLIGGIPCKVQMNFNIIVVGSKDLPRV